MLGHLNLRVGDVVDSVKYPGQHFTVVELPKYDNTSFSDYWKLWNAVSGHGRHRDGNWRIVSRADPAADDLRAVIHNDPDGSLYRLLYPFVGDDGMTRVLRMELAKWVGARAALRDTQGGAAE